MYRKRKKYLEKAIDDKIALICDDLIKINPEVDFAVSKKFIESKHTLLAEESEKIIVIISSAPLEELKIPGSLNLKNDSCLTTWCDNEPLAKLVYIPFKFIDGETNGKKVKHLYLDLDLEQKNIKLKK